MVSQRHIKPFCVSSVLFPPELQHRRQVGTLKVNILCSRLYLNEVFNIKVTAADQNLTKWQKKRAWKSHVTKHFSNQLASKVHNKHWSFWFPKHLRSWWWGNGHLKEFILICRKMKCIWVQLMGSLPVLEWPVHLAGAASGLLLPSSH